MKDIEYKKHYVAFLDILGFKSIIKEKSCQEINDIFSNVKKPELYFFDGNKTISDNDYINFKIMSDNVIFYIDASIPDALTQLLTNCAVLQADLLSLNDPVLLRGAIVCDDLYYENENDIIYGKALTNAYLLEEKNAKYPRIIIKKHDLNLDDEMQKIITYLDDDYYYSVNCYLAINRGKRADAIIKTIRNRINNVLDTEDDNSIREKYIYLQKRMNDFKMGDYNV